MRANKKLFVIVFERPCMMGCSDYEIRLCRAIDMNEAWKIAMEHRNKFYVGWLISITTVAWDKDGTAYVWMDYQ